MGLRYTSAGQFAIVIVPQILLAQQRKHGPGSVIRSEPEI